MTTQQRTRTQWTKPFYGVSHFGEYGTDKYWATIEDHGSFVVLKRWLPGCKFSPHVTDYTTIEAAKKQGERWTNAGILNQI